MLCIAVNIEQATPVRPGRKICNIVVWLFVSSCVYEIPRLLSLLVLACMIDQGWIPRRVVSAYDVVNASYLPTTINIYDLEIRSINNYRKSYDIASFLVSTKISRRCRFGNSKPCKYIRSSYVRRNCIYDNNRVSANISSYDYR